MLFTRALRYSMLDTFAGRNIGKWIPPLYKLGQRIQKTYETKNDCAMGFR